MDRYCLVADLMGFRKIIENLDVEQQADRITAWTNLAEKAKTKFSIPYQQLISDTIFASTDDTEDGLSTLIRYAQFLLNECVPKSLPLRGAISFGQVEWGGEITYGKAITEAYIHCENQEWVGISGTSKLEVPPRLWDWETLVGYTVPLKTGPLNTLPAVVWDIPYSDNLMSALVGEGLVDYKNDMDWRWARKFQNTILFSVYLCMMDPYRDRYYPQYMKGIIPAQLPAAMILCESVKLARLLRNGDSYENELELDRFKKKSSGHTFAEG
ncbi:MAG: hypothetical protein K2Z81_23705 [Cyanobacteria bacterium]|nr:hypothetical protein [Cyanobacteriota bacterium]